MIPLYAETVVKYPFGKLTPTTTSLEKTKEHLGIISKKKESLAASDRKFNTFFFFKSEAMWSVTK